MAQLASKKKSSRFQPELDACNLVSYTTQIMLNEKYFPESVQKTIVPIIYELLLSIADNVNIANSINVKASLRKEQLIKNYKLRLDLENKAIKDCYLLKSKISILYNGFNLAGHKARSWNAKVEETIFSLTKWRESEVKKYREL